MKKLFTVLTILALSGFVACSKSDGNGNENGGTSAGGKYKIGDYYENGDVKGVVFKVNGKHGKIVSLEQTSCRWSNGEFRDIIPELDDSDGEINMRIIQTFTDWRTYFPAFAWCADFGDGWYLPAIEEIKELSDAFGRAPADRYKFNQAIINNGGDAIIESIYWSSSAHLYIPTGTSKAVYIFDMGRGTKDDTIYDYSENLVRAIRAF